MIAALEKDGDPLSHDFAKAQRTGRRGYAHGAHLWRLSLVVAG